MKSIQSNRETNRFAVDFVTLAAALDPLSFEVCAIVRLTAATFHQALLGQTIEGTAAVAPQHPLSLVVVLAQSHARTRYLGQTKHGNTEDWELAIDGNPAVYWSQLTVDVVTNLWPLIKLPS